MKGRTYRYFTGEPLYPFGYGLSCTTFEHSNLTFDKSSVDAKGDVTATVAVKNTGSMASDEVVQIYLTPPGAKGAPIRALAGFRRVHLDPGESKKVEVTVRNRNLSFMDESSTRRIPRGTLQVWVGGGQPVRRDGLSKTAGVSGSVKSQTRQCCRNRNSLEVIPCASQFRHEA
jgi:beta-glucosidase